MTMRFCLSVIFPAMLGCGIWASGQESPPASAGTGKTAVPITLGQSVAALNGPWKFETGDSPIDAVTHEPLWAEPDFDDSDWETVDLTPQPGSSDPFNGDPRYVGGWTSLGHAEYMGWAWYRMRVLVEEPKEQLGMEGPFWMEDGYQVFANGKLLGGFGKFGNDGRIVTYSTQPAMFLLPETRTGGPVAITVAFRVWMGLTGFLHFPDAGGLHYAPLLGGAKAIAAQNLLDWQENILANIWTPFEGAVLLLLGVLAASLILLDRGDRVYPWLAGILFFSAGFDFLVNATASWTQWISERFYFLYFQGILLPLHMGGWLMVWWMWFRLRRPAWVPWLIGGLTAMYMVFGVAAENVVPGATARWLSAVIAAGPGVTRSLFLGLLIFIIWLGVQEDGLTALFVVPAVAPIAGLHFQTELILLHMPVQWHPMGINFTIGNLANLVLGGALAVLLLRRLTQSLKRKRRMALDVKAAQEVQQVILPEAWMKVPGLTIESEYRPANEVGGDFFQVIPHPSDGSVLIVAGDVTGKGLKAGMLVALLVGAIRSAAEWSTEPEAILKTLNARLMGRGDAKATCLAMRIEADGSGEVANAAHMAPYLNGEPMEMEGSLPLGILEDPGFSVMRFKLAEGDRLTLVSDGVPEATDTNGKLLGFERTHELVKTLGSAAEVARAAQDFGQEDDISVICVTRISDRVEGSALDGRKEPQWSEA
jgi:uncharacterized protein (DUF2062 family)